MREANALRDDVTALRAQMDEDGYLLFRNAIDPHKLTVLREQITTILAGIGWILGDEQQLDARAAGLPQREGEEGYFEAHDKIVKLEAFHALAHDEKLMHIIRQSLGEDVFAHPLSIVRLVFPNNPEITTPPHQDYPNNQGSEKLTAAWIPLHDCPIEMGALAILKGSHKNGLLPLQFHMGPGNRCAVIPQTMHELEWVSTDFQVGDVLLFPALTVHSALENKDPERMRLSVDYRYQLEGEALTENSLKPHFSRLSWEEIYRDWQSTDLQYYWYKKRFDVIPWQNLHELPDDHVKDAMKQCIRYENKRQQRYAENRLHHHEDKAV
ncbi:phytanoyl-CoA dioxygenase family protein [Kineobactrum sediminis]|nr:phytanoyl-CoA dioxygenase family protein [Kineobactrum sediminis]